MSMITFDMMLKAGYLIIRDLLDSGKKDFFDVLHDQLEERSEKMTFIRRLTDEEIIVLFFLSRFHQISFLNFAFSADEENENLANDLVGFGAQLENCFWDYLGEKVGVERKLLTVVKGFALVKKQN
jgi:hypothetical protein